MSGQEAIQVQALTKRYGARTVVDSLHLTVHAGECFALLGVNGAGKTTTIRMLSGLTRPTSGDAWLCGHSILTDLRGVRSCIGVSPQETAVAPHLTVQENLLLMSGLYGAPRAEQIRCVDALSARLRLNDVLCQKAATLSGGYQRRLSIAMALIGKPRILFLDEPTLGLDILARRELWDVIRELTGSVTMILTTHYMEEAEQLASRVGILKAGHLLALGSPSELMEQTGTSHLEDAFLHFVKEEIR